MHHAAHHHSARPACCEQMPGQATANTPQQCPSGNFNTFATDTDKPHPQACVGSDKRLQEVTGCWADQDRRCWCTQGVTQVSHDLWRRHLFGCDTYRATPASETTNTTNNSGRIGQRYSDTCRGMFSSQDSGQKCNRGNAQPKQQQRTSSNATATLRKRSINPLAHWLLLACCRPAACSALTWLLLAADSDAATTLQPATDTCAAQQLADLQHVAGQTIVGAAAAWPRHCAPCCHHPGKEHQEECSAHSVQHTQQPPQPHMCQAPISMRGASRPAEQPAD